MSGPDLGWIERAQAAGLSRDDIQAYLDAWSRPIAPVDSAAERRRARDREYQKNKREEDRRQISAESADGVHIDKDSNNIITIKTISRSRRQTSADFAEFKAAYPKRKGKYNWPVAEKKFDRLIASGVLAEEIMEGVRRYADLMDQTGKTGTEFVQQASTWLNQEGWRDDGAAEETEQQRYERAREAFRNGTRL